jgi:mannose-6-phosphate isomerase-like protein (cupin superfamily)
MQVVHNAFTDKAEVFDQLKELDYWPTTYVSEAMDELPVHWHDFDNVGYVIEGSTYVLDEANQRIELGPGDKLVIPRGAIHAEGAVTERTVYIVGLPMAANLFDVLIDFKDPATSPLRADEV